MHKIDIFLAAMDVHRIQALILQVHILAVLIVVLIAAFVLMAELVH